MYRLNRLHMAAVIVSLPYACAAGLLLAKRGQWLPTELLATIACAVLVNSFVAAASSGPHDRFGSRLIWLLPFFALASCHQILDSLGPSGAGLRAPRGSRDFPSARQKVAQRNAPGPDRDEPGPAPKSG